MSSSGQSVFVQGQDSGPFDFVSMQDVSPMIMVNHGDDDTKMDDGVFAIDDLLNIELADLSSDNEILYATEVFEYDSNPPVKAELGGHQNAINVSSLSMDGQMTPATMPAFQHRPVDETGLVLRSAAPMHRAAKIAHQGDNIVTKFTDSPTDAGGFVTAQMPPGSNMSLVLDTSGRDLLNPHVNGGVDRSFAVPETPQSLSSQYESFNNTFVGSQYESSNNTSLSSPYESFVNSAQQNPNMTPGVEHRQHHLYSTLSGTNQMHNTDHTLSFQAPAVSDTFASTNNLHSFGAMNRALPQAQHPMVQQMNHSGTSSNRSSSGMLPTVHGDYDHHGWNFGLQNSHSIDHSSSYPAQHTANNGFSNVAAFSALPSINTYHVNNSLPFVPTGFFYNTTTNGTSGASTNNYDSYTYFQPQSNNFTAYQANPGVPQSNNLASYQANAGVSHSQANNLTAYQANAAVGYNSSAIQSPAPGPAATALETEQAIAAPCCYCRKPDVGVMVICSDPDHTGPQKYHLACLEMKKMPRKDWVCDECYGKTLVKAKFDADDDESYEPEPEPKRRSKKNVTTKTNSKPTSGVAVARASASVPASSTASASTPTRPYQRKRACASAWSEAEDQVCIAIMSQLVKERNSGGPKDRIDNNWNKVSVQMKRQGYERSAAAIKNQWNRRLRAKSGIDERARPRPEFMRTGVLVTKYDIIMDNLPVKPFPVRKPAKTKTAKKVERTKATALTLEGGNGAVLPPADEATSNALDATPVPSDGQSDDNME